METFARIILSPQRIGRIENTPYKMKTRSKKTTKATASKESPEQNETTAKELAPSVTTPPHVFVLPKGASPEARIITLPNPASASPNRYFVCPEKGFYEFTKISAPKKACRSWLLAPQDREEKESENDTDGADSHEDEGHVIEQPAMFVATRIDPVFVLLPLLVGGETGSYLTFSDYVFTTEIEGLGQLQQLLRQSTFARLEKIMEARIDTACDCLDMGDGEDKMYQLSATKLAATLLSKARNMAKNGLPASMEERFVKQTLEVPVLSVRREESSVSIAPDDATPGAESENISAETSQDSSSSAATVSTAATTASIAASSIATTPAEIEPLAENNIVNLLRIRTALDFLITSYVPTGLHKTIQDSVKIPTSSVDFAPLDKHLEHIAGVKKQAQVLRSLSDNISRKRGADDEEALDKAEAKRKKKEEEEIKKKNMSRGVQQLAKANTTGMKKLSSFFTKAPPKKKA